MRDQVTLVLDLEDGVGDAFLPGRTPGLKAQARKHLAGLLARTPGLLDRLRLGVRVNSVDGAEFEQDLALLQEISRAGTLACIVLPKVTLPEQIEQCQRRLAESEIRYEELVPIVESPLGRSNLERIAAAPKIKWLVYGHYDDSLEAGDWPILEHDETLFWERVLPFIHTVKTAGLGYIHPPFPHTQNDNALAQTISRLAQCCAREYGIITVTARQTRLCNQLAASTRVPSDPVPLRQSSCQSAGQLVDMALVTIRTYQAHVRENYTFALVPSTGRFISVHEYLAATRFLERTYGGPRL